MGFFKTLGHAFTSGAKAVGGTLHEVGGVIKKVPVVGKPIASVYNLGTAPVSFAVDVASGTRIDHAALNNIRGQLRDIKSVAPYVQTVVSFVPGVGTGVSGAIAASLAIADGKKLSEAVLQAAAGAVPGGSIAQGAFKGALAVTQGKSIDQAAIDALPVPDTQKNALRNSLDVVKKVSEGKKPQDALFEASLRNLPPEVGNAVRAGLAMGHAAKIQASASQVKADGVAVPFVVHADTKAPGAAISVAEGIAAGDRLVRAYNGRGTPAEQAHAKAVVAATKKAAETSTGSHRAAALNGLTLLKKRAAAQRAALRFTVDGKGYVRYRRAAA